MNQQQRKTLQNAISALTPFADADHCLEVGADAVIDAVDEAKSVFEDIAQEERDKFDNLPEGFQNGDRGAAMEEAADALESAVSDLENVDLTKGKAPDEDWHEEVSGFIQEAIDNAESF